ncbi:pentatricopeptide repeat-containing protein At3g06430, chloroplastic [Asparagus officinalis]|uniref:pentatricopeptide repeat-containing protein At3g06430, chloroplastic n=1 Tax=Asparagus officinalis TaxID=4686 RepID=UPI00098E1FBD|nr:pentatricopeptide repeat-containing protein At3g06430, chloroplastic [Asparagus officinalis]
MASSSCSFSFSSSLLNLHSQHNKPSSSSPSAFAFRPRKTPHPPSRSSSSTSRSRTLTPKRSSPSPPQPPPATPRKKHWKEGEFPGVSEGALPSRRGPIKNVKKKIEDRAEAKAWVPTVTETLADKIQRKQWQDALEVFEMLKEQIFYYPKVGTYVKLLVLLGKSGQAIRAHQLFDEMLEAGIEPTAELYTALLAAYCRSNLLDQAYSILDKMKSLPFCQPDVFTYSTLLKACVESSRFDLVESLYQEMSDRMITPNTVTQNTVLGGYGKAGKFDEMEKILSGMLESSTCRPDVWTMNIILALFGNKGQIDMMEKWYEKFRSIGIEPETQTFNILIGAYGKKKMYDKMTAVMEYMRKLQFPWTTSTYNNVIEAFADVGDAKNMDYTFNQMRAEGMRADTKTFCCLVDGFSNAGLFHKVVSSIQLAERLDVSFNTSFYNSVLSACAKAGDLMEMERVFNQMKDKYYTPDSTTYSILVEAYRKEGMNDKIFYLEQEEQKTSQLEHVG